VKTVRLGEIVEVVSGATPKTGVPEFWGGDIQWATPADLSRLHGTIIADTPRKLTQAGLDSCGAKLLPAGSVLLSSRAPIGHLAINTVPMATNQGFKSLVPGGHANARYLYHWLAFRVDYLKSLGNGATFKELSKQTVEQIEIPLPSLEEQRRIAAILDQAGTLRAKRRQVLAHLDALNQSIFQDIFDGRQTKAALLGDVAEVVSGITKGRRTTEPTQPFPYLAVANVQAGHLKLDTVKTIDATDSEVSRFALRTGDLVLTEGGDPDKLGRGTVWRGEIATCLHQNHVFRVRLSQDSQVLPDYLSAFLAGREAKSYFLRSAKQTTGIASINMTQLKGLSIVVPPLMDQSRYVERIANINSCGDRAKESVMMHDRLFAALQSRAFRGEL